MRWSRLLFAAALLLGTVACAAAAYLQTEDAFSRLIVPCVDLLNGTQTTIERGRITWAGRLEIRGLRWRDPARGLSLAIERASLRFAPASLAFGELPVLRRGRIVGAALSIAGGAADGETDGSGRSHGSVSEIPLPFAIEQLDAEDLALRVGDVEQPSLAVRRGRVTVRGLIADGEATVAVHATVDAAPSGGASHSGTLDADLAFVQQDGFLRGVAGTLGFDLFRLGAAAPESVRLAAAFEAALEETNRVSPHASSLFRVERLDVRLEKSGRPLIEVELAAPLRLDLDPGSESAPPPRRSEASLVARGDVDLAELNRWVRVLGGAGFEPWTQGRLQARLAATVAGTGERIGLTGTARLFALDRGWDQALPGLAHLDVEAKVRGTLDALRRLDLERAELRLARARRTQARVRAGGRFDLVSGDANASLQIEIPRLVEAWRRFVPPAPAPPLAGAGRLAAEQTVVRRADDSALRLSGHVDVAGVRFAGDEAGSPQRRLELHNDVVVGLDDGSIRLDTALLRLVGDDGERRGSIAASGFLPLGDTGERDKLRIEARDLDGAAWLRLAGVHLRDDRALTYGANLTAGRDAGGALSVDGVQRVRFTGSTAAGAPVLTARGRVKASIDENGFLVTVQPTSLAGGTIEGRLERERSGTRSSSSLDVEATGVDLEPIVRTLVPEDRHQIRGRLDLDASVRGEGDWRASAAGNVVAGVSQGHVAQLALLAFMSRELKLRGLDVLDFDRLDAEIAVADGVAHVRRGELRSPTVRLFVAGTATLGGRLDLRVQPRLGPELVPERSRLAFATKIARTVDGLLTLPVEVTVTGEWSEPRYAIRPTAPGVLTTTGEAVEKTVTGVVDTVEGAAGAVRRLFRKAEPEHDAGRE